MMFLLGHVLSVTTGRLCCDIGGVYEILNHVTGDNLYTHVLPRACKFARPLILAAHPSLKTVPVALLDKLISEHGAQAGVKAWLADLGRKHASQYDIASYADKWLSLNPLDELEGMVGKEKIIVVTP